MLVFVFALTYCSTWAIVGKIYASEIQPVQTRAAANSVAQGLGFVCHIKNRPIYMLTCIVYELAGGFRHSHLPCTLLLWRILLFWRPVPFHARHTRGLHA